MFSRGLSGVFVFVFCLICGIAGGQERACFRVVFYNVENLFDTRKDSVKADGNFTPRGRLYWTKERYSRKLLHISRALIEAGGEALPSVIGLAEVENRHVLVELVGKTGLAEGLRDCTRGFTGREGNRCRVVVPESGFSGIAKPFLPGGVGKGGKDTGYPVLRGGVGRK